MGRRSAGRGVHAGEIFSIQPTGSTIFRDLPFPSSKLPPRPQRLGRALCEVARLDDGDPGWVQALAEGGGDLVRRQGAYLRLEVGVPRHGAVQEAEVGQLVRQLVILGAADLPLLQV